MKISVILIIISFLVSSCSDSLDQGQIDMPTEKSQIIDNNSDIGNICKNQGELFIYDPISGIGSIIVQNPQSVSMRFHVDWTGGFSSNLDVYSVGRTRSVTGNRILFYNRVLNEVSFYYDNTGLVLEWSGNLPDSKKQWEIYVAGDTDGDNKNELFIYNKEGRTGMFYGQNGSTFGNIEWQSSTFRPTWEIYPVGDVDGDGKAELFLFDRNDGTGIFYGQNGNGPSNVEWQSSTFRTTWEIYPAGDVDGDGKTELFLYDRYDNTGVFYGYNIPFPNTEWQSKSFRNSWEVYKAGDTDNDGRDELFLVDRGEGIGVYYGANGGAGLNTEKIVDDLCLGCEILPLGKFDRGYNRKYLNYTDILFYNRSNNSASFIQRREDNTILRRGGFIEDNPNISENNSVFVVGDLSNRCR